jgi:hypothetical protein
VTIFRGMSKREDGKTLLDFILRRNTGVKWYLSFIMHHTMNKNGSVAGTFQRILKLGS